jgi:hypothetical protein
MTDYTPGPWKARSRNAGQPGDDFFLGWQIEGPPEPQRGQFVREADAHLVAAAPDMYEALAMAEEVLAEFPANSRWWPIYKAITEALAKARGETPCPTES